MNKVKVLGLSLTLVFASILINGATSAYAGNGCFNNNNIDAQLHIIDGTI